MTEPVVNPDVPKGDDTPAPLVTDPATPPVDGVTPPVPPADGTPAPPATPPAEPPAPTPEEIAAQQNQEIAELRGLVRQMKRETTSLKTELESTKKGLKDAGALPEADPNDPDAVKAQQSAELRVSQLDTMLEVMRVSPTYADVDKVVSQAHFDDVIEAMADQYVEEKGGNKEDVIPALEKYVWSLKNPYRFMYDKIKELHPEYIKKAAPVIPEPAKPGSAPPSLPSIPGGSGGGSGWTAARIDALPEKELPTVPRDVYDLYMKGLLK